MINLKWRYSELIRGNRQGISNAAIESFAGNRIASLTREICQNSLDAKDKDVTGPVIIHFKEFDLDRKHFPDINGLTESFENALIETGKLKDQKAYDTINKSLEAIKQDKISFLRISDFNTTGLDGINSKDQSPWNNLVSAEGISDKDSSAGGSFGIGKNASFATSELRTVFYATINGSGEKAITGVANLPSYDLNNGESFTQGPEFLGVDEKNTPYDNLISLDKSFDRSQKGTDIYVAGFIKDDNEINIIKEILNNYLYAIYEESLVVEVNKVLINKANLEKLLNKYERELEEQTMELYKLLTYPNVNIYKERILEENDIEVRIILDKVASNTVSMIRRPWMKVFNKAGYRKHYSFFGVCLIKGKKLNELLRKAENPQHNQWEPDRVQGKKAYVIKTIDSINKVIRDILEKLHEIDVPESLDVFGAGDYIPMDIEGNQKAQGKVEEKVLEIEVKPVKKNIDEKMINEYKEEGNYVIDLDGNVDIEVIHEPTKDYSKTDEKNESKSIKPRGLKIGLDRRAVRVISNNNNDGVFNIILNSNREYKSANMRVTVLDEQGTIVSNVLNVLSAKIDNNNYYTANDMIYNLFLKEGLNKISIKTNLSILVSLGVEIYENK